MPIVLKSRREGVMDNKEFNKEKWDEIQETIMIVGALGLWAGFEVLCFLNESYAAATHTSTTRLALITIATNLFTFKFTKSQLGGVLRNGAK